MLRLGFDRDPAAAVLNASGPLNCIPHLLQSREKLVRVESKVLLCLGGEKIHLLDILYKVLLRFVFFFCC